MSKVFHALTLNPSGVMEGVRVGIGGLTEARTSRIYQRDWEDIWRSWESGEPAWFGGRKVENLCPESEDFATGWANVNTVDSVDATIAPPSGVSIVTKLAQVTSTGVQFIRRQDVAYQLGSENTLSLRVRPGTATICYLISLGRNPSDDNGEIVFFDLSAGTVGTELGGVTGTIVDAGGGWFRIGMQSPSDYSSSVNIEFRLGISHADGIQVSTLNAGEFIHIAGAQLENVSGQADQTLSEYVPTMTAAAHKIFGTDRAGVPLASLPWLYGGPAGTNEITFSRDLTNAAWTVIGANVAALDAVGLEGIANTASTLTDNDGALLENVNDNAAISNDANTHVARFFIKKDTDTTRFPELQFILQGGTLQRFLAQLNTQTGDITSRVPVGTVAVEVNQVGDWWEVLISVANNTSGNTLAAVFLYPAITTTLGSTEVAATGSIIVGNVALHLNKTIAQVRGSTPIFTSGSTVTVDASDLSFDDANHADLEGAYFCEFKNVGLDASNLGGLVGVGAAGRILFANTAVEIKAFDGTLSALGPSITLAADDTEYKIGLAYGSSLHRVNVDDSWGTAVAFDGTYDNSLNKIRALGDLNTTGDLITVMLLRNLRRYDLDYVAAQAKIESLMAGDAEFYSHGTGINEFGGVLTTSVAFDFSGVAGDIFIGGTRHAKTGRMYVTFDSPTGNNTFINGLLHSEVGIRYVELVGGVNDWPEGFASADDGTQLVAASPSGGILLRGILRGTIGDMYVQS